MHIVLVKVPKQADYHPTSQNKTKCTSTTLLHLEQYATVMHLICRGGRKGVAKQMGATDSSQ